MDRRRIGGREKLRNGGGKDGWRGGGKERWREEGDLKDGCRKEWKRKYFTQSSVNLPFLRLLCRGVWRAHPE